ncbi:hypothetical protein [Chachezhania sediminis]|uniref:hypothetical protein n=1 Tax=Chachezhania sediminis TaxID=2599291 RepID=UPI00131B105A|nr:hypothetical protein [Chachezhania sediminis]
MAQSNSDADDFLYEAARFRGLAYFNDRDFDYVCDGGDVRYYIDAGVILALYIWPGRFAWPLGSPDSEANNRDYISNIGDPISAEEVAEAALTGEFLFSDALHSKARALRKSPRPEAETSVRRFILEPHWKELAARLTEFVNEGLAWPADAERGKPSKEKLLAEYDSAHARAKKIRKAYLDQYNEAVRNGADKPNLDLNKIGHVIDISATFEDTEILQRAMVRRFRFSRPVEPALHLPAEIQDIDALEPWHEDLKQFAKSPSAARNDAIAIAQIEALNRASIEAGDRTIHCLVSGDKHLHEVYYKRKAKLYAHEQGIDATQIDLETGDFSESYYLRHPGQFVPMLNQADMPNQITDESLFDEVVAAAEATLALKRCSERDALDMAMLAVRTSKENFKSKVGQISNKRLPDDDQLREQSDELKDKWNRLRRATLLVNRRLLQSRADFARGLRSELRAEHDEMSDPLQREQLETTLAIQRVSLYWAARRGLVALSESLRQKGEGREDRNRLPLLVELSVLTDGSVYEAAQKLKKPRSDQHRRKIDENIHRLSEEETWKGLLLCAALACYADAWSEAVWFAERAHNAIHAEASANPDAMLDKAYAEAAYILGYACRMRMAKGDFFQRARDSLDESERRGRAISCAYGALVRARALSERATVQLFEQARRLEAGEERLNASALHEQRSAFVSALQIIDGLDPGELNEQEVRARKYILRQATLNLCVFDAIGHMVPGNSLNIPDTVTDADLSREIAAQRAAWLNASDEAVVTDIDRIFLDLVDAFLNGASVQEVQDLHDQLSALGGGADLHGLDKVIARELRSAGQSLLELCAARA